MVLPHCGMVKDSADPFFPPPPSKMFLSFYLLFILLDYNTLSLYLNTYEWSIPMRESIFQTNKFIANCGVGKDWADPIFPPFKIFWFFYWLFSLSVYATLLQYLNTYEWPVPKRESSFQTKQVYWYFYIVGSEKTGPAHSSPPPPSPPFKMLLIFLSILQSFGLCYSFILSEHL